MAMWFVHALNAALLGLLIWLAVQFPESEAAFWLAIAGAITALGFYALARWRDWTSTVNKPLMGEVYRLPKEEQQVVSERVKPLMYLITMALLLMASWFSFASHSTPTFASQGTLSGLSPEVALAGSVVLILLMQLFVLLGWVAWFNYKTSQQIRAYNARQAAAPKDDTPAKRVLEVEELETADPLPGMRPLSPAVVRVVHAVTIGLAVLLVGAVVLLPEQWPETLIGALMGIPCAGLLYALTWVPKSKMYNKQFISALPAAEHEAVFQRLDMVQFGCSTLILLLGVAVAVLPPEVFGVRALMVLTLLIVVAVSVYMRWLISYLNERIAA